MARMGMAVTDMVMDITTDSMAVDVRALFQRAVTADNPGTNLNHVTAARVVKL
jgi:hypothetical protein